MESEEIVTILQRKRRYKYYVCIKCNSTGAHPEECNPPICPDCLDRTGQEIKMNRSINGVVIPD